MLSRDRQLDHSSFSPKTHLHHHQLQPVDIPASVTKSPGPSPSVHVRSPGKSHLQQLLQQHCPLGSVTQRLTGGAPTAGANGHGNLLPHQQQQQQQQQHHQHHLHQQTGPHSKLPGSHSLQDRLRQQRSMLLKRLAIWLTLGIAAIVLLSSLAPAAEVPPAPPKDVLLDLGPYFFNPSIVRHRGVFLSTARTAHMKRIDKTNWWFNEAYICMSTTAEFNSVSCRKFDPWQGRFQECLWGSERKVADVDTQGVEDPKLFVWPGKGVYAVFGRKPEALGASPYCKDPIFVQFVVQVVSEKPDDKWSIHRPTELKPGIFRDQLYKDRKSAEPIKEKNWMPFVWQEQLMVVHSVFPHRVFRMNSSGIAAQQFLTTSPQLFAPYKDEDIHGGPPLALVPAALSNTGRDYYLGIFHFFKTFGEGINKVKVYHHYAYRVEAAPPFKVCGVSQEISLVTRKRQDNKKAADWTHQRIWKDTSQTAYISGLILDGDTVHISYGSSDIDARLLSMNIADLEALFEGSPFDCSSSSVLDAGSGEPLPPDAAAAAAVSSNGVAVSGTSGIQAAVNGNAIAAAVGAGSGGIGFNGPRRVRRTEYLRHHRHHRRYHHRDHKNLLKHKA